MTRTIFWLVAAICLASLNLGVGTEGISAPLNTAGKLTEDVIRKPVSRQLLISQGLSNITAGPEAASPNSLLIATAPAPSSARESTLISSGSSRRSPSPAPPARQLAPPPSTLTTSSASGSVTKNEPTSAQCDVFTDEDAQCGTSGGSNFLIPACCSTVSTDLCGTNDDASGGTCTDAGAYPSCCPAVNQPAGVCESTQSADDCVGDLPVFACCGTATCAVNDDGSGTTCTKGVASCCPA